MNIKNILFISLLAFTPLAVADLPTVVENLNPKPPRIVVENGPSRLMLVDGPPALIDIPATRLSFVVNTDWTVFRDGNNQGWYILDGETWLYSNLLSSGDWRATADLPRDFLTLQVNSDWPQVARALPPRKPADQPLPIVISYEPTELIVVEGEMQFETIGGGGLQYVSNTERDLFYFDGRYYYLAAGRWFATKDVKRKWYAVKQLPKVFAEIPEGHPRGRVLTAVPGTPAAVEAAREAARPQRTVVVSGEGDDIKVPWIGEPTFTPIEGTPLRRGENTPFQVIQHNNFFYLCHGGAWYSSSRPDGSWDAAREVPEAIYTIPATDPAFNVTFVKLDAFDDSSGRAAYVATSGYYSRYYDGSKMVYGTGWYYPGYHRGYAYWRYPWTYGHHGPWGTYYPYNYHSSETYDVTRRESDWQWDLDGGKRKVYRYGPQHNVVGGDYVLPSSDKPGAGSEY
ncbi:MAG: hypothetical protein KJO70_10710 [Gammaproteobacteria bacterium]|nr:hypothetical protein [Gammaproteobacteria bacterium]MBT8051658.1 hypothetical protein [Gammaproteobacteria bacterium]MBT8057645.1 hypothetical protein [Gammaproteobacteria bacterium]NNJ77763.1 hypothetical protein [Xanthomonadales bacterium]